MNPVQPLAPHRLGSTHTEPVLLRSTVLSSIGVPHAFTTRQGGVSQGIFASLNFGNPAELTGAQRDPRSNIDANIRLTLEAMGSAGRSLVEVHQVHGGATHIVHAGRPAHDQDCDTKADAIATADASRVVGVRVADCVPVLIASADGHCVAAAHAGWRGVVLGVVGAGVRALREELGATELAAAIGPCIGPGQFEVGPEVVEEFRRVGLLDAADPRPSPAGRTLLDLQGAIAHQLKGLGVESIESLAYCTCERPDLFFSHRRDRGLTGRMMGLIGPRA